VDPEGEHNPQKRFTCCQHVNFVNSKGSFVDKELEYLFAAYSVFEVRSVDWCDDGSRPSDHRVWCWMRR
jgi:hypothetical protein